MPAVFVDPGSASRTILSCSAASDRFIWAGYDDFGPPELKQQLTEAVREEREVVDADHFARIYRRQLDRPIFVLYVTRPPVASLVT